MASCPKLDAWRELYVGGEMWPPGWDDLAKGDPVAREAFRSLQSALVDAQRGLCAYCETRITAPTRPSDDSPPRASQMVVEHYAPRSPTSYPSDATIDPDRFTNPNNLLASCLGGQRATGHNAKVAHPSCDHAKGDRFARAELHPHQLPWPEPLVEVGLDGEMRAHHGACAAQGIDPENVDAHLKILGLNAPRLKRSRAGIQAALAHDDHTEGRFDEGLTFMEELRPDSSGRLPTFWTTLLCFARDEGSGVWTRLRQRIQDEIQP